MKWKLILTKQPRKADWILTVAHSSQFLAISSAAPAHPPLLITVTTAPAGTTTAWLSSFSMPILTAVAWRPSFCLWDLTKLHLRFSLGNVEAEQLGVGVEESGFFRRRIPRNHFDALPILSCKKQVVLGFWFWFWVQLCRWIAEREAEGERGLEGWKIGRRRGGWWLLA